MSTTYKLTAINASNEPWDFCLFQKSPTGLPAGAVSLAWFHQYVPAHGKTIFSWEIDYTLLWDRTGVLVPGVTFDTSQSFPADPTTVGSIAAATQAGQGVGLTYHNDKDYHEFIPTDPNSSAAKGSLYVACDGSVPNNVAAVGIGMSGAGTFAVNALTNVTTVFTPQPEYWLVADDHFQDGEVLENEVTGAQPLHYDSIFAMTATYQSNHTWSVIPAP
jgi:hypothetical protein